MVVLSMQHAAMSNEMAPDITIAHIYGFAVACRNIFVMSRSLYTRIMAPSLAEERSRADKKPSPRVTRRSMSSYLTFRAGGQGRLKDAAKIGLAHFAFRVITHSPRAHYQN